MLPALTLTLLGAAGTAVGGLLVVMQPQMSYRTLGIFQGVAAGLMLSISFLDLLPEASEAIGAPTAQLWFYGGVALFALIVAAIPEPSTARIVSIARSTSGRHIPDISKIQAAVAPDDDTPDRDENSKQRRMSRRQVLVSGLVTALGIALHNFPEGMAVLLASNKSHAIGLSLAVAIALHNIPEGIAVALPVYFATGSRLQGFWYAFLSGLAEPLAVIVFGLVYPVQFSKSSIDMTLAGVGGVMAFLSLHELMPLSFKHAGQHTAALALFSGMVIMSINLYVLDQWLGVHDH